MEMINHFDLMTNYVLLTILLAILPLFTTCYEIRAIENLRSLEMLSLTIGAGPESLAFDPSGGGPYTGVSNGRVLKWKGGDLRWVEFAFNSNHRNEECGVYNNEMMESKCGRPLGLQFHKATGDLYIADAYLGLLTVGPEGGPVTLVAAEADGLPFNFTNGVDIDQETGMVYFTDSSIHFQRREYMMLVLSGDASGRLMRYDPATKRVTVLESGLAFPNGLVVSHDNTHLLVAMTSPCRILKYWLRGPRTGTFETFAELPGYPDNIKRNSKGEYWVALGQEKIQLNGLQKRVANFEPMLDHPIALRLSQEGRVLEVLDGGIMTSISEVEERNGSLWLGSVVSPFVGVYEA